MPRKKLKMFKGTDAQAFNVAGKKGKTPQQRSAIYYAEKRKNRKKQRIKSLIEGRSLRFPTWKLCLLQVKCWQIPRIPKKNWTKRGKWY